jgi:hypothetical protein
MVLAGRDNTIWVLGQDALQAREAEHLGQAHKAEHFENSDILRPPGAILVREEHGHILHGQAATPDIHHKLPVFHTKHTVIVA